MDGATLLAVEVLSPYDKVKDIDDTIDEYFDCNVAEVWIVDPDDETLTLYRKNHVPVFFTKSDTFFGDPLILPGLTFPIVELFA